MKYSHGVQRTPSADAGACHNGLMPANMSAMYLADSLTDTAWQSVPQRLHTLSSSGRSG
jgi:hypothetical protein